MPLSSTRGLRQGLVALLFILAGSLAALPLDLRAIGSGQRIEAAVTTAESTMTDLVLTLRFPGFRTASLGSGRYSEGLSLVAESDRPYVDDSGQVGSELVLELASPRGGRARVESLRIEGEGGSFEIAPFDLSFPEKVGAPTPPDAWIWKAPSRVWAFQTFAVQLRPIEASRIDASAWPSFVLPSGLLFEAGADSFSWVATGLESGTLVLPETRILGPSEGIAPATSLLVVELPKSIRASRAIGNFTLSLDAPGEGRGGESLRLRLILTGEGNLPVLRLPEFRLSLDDRNIQVQSADESRIDSIQKTATGYKGSIALDIDVVPKGGGVFSFSTLPWRFLDSEGRELVIGTLRRTIQIRPPQGVDLSGSQAQALQILESLKGKAALVAIEKLKSGKKAEALAEFYHAAREEAGYRGPARRLAASLGASAPDLGSPLPYAPFFAAAGLLALATLLLFLIRREKRVEAWLIMLCGLLAIAALATATYSLLDKERPRWLTLATSMASTPSPDSERRVALPLGSTGRKIGSSGEWICLEFPDGTAGWLPRSSVYSY